MCVCMLIKKFLIIISLGKLKEMNEFYKQIYKLLIIIETF